MMGRTSHMNCLCGGSLAATDRQHMVVHRRYRAAAQRHSRALTQATKMATVRAGQENASFLARCAWLQTGAYPAGRAVTAV